MKNYFKIGLLVLWMGVIYLFSSQTGTESTQSSQFVLSLIQFLGIDINSVLGHLSQLVVRKSAHLFEYFIMSLLIYNLIRDHIRYEMILSIIFSTLYACSDEFHQLFVVNRVSSVNDVLVDTLGAILAMIFVYLIKILKMIKSSK